MKVSILITYYNQKRYVPRSLSRALAQKTNYDVEILVGDDGSTDGTVEEVSKFIERYPDKIRLFQMPRDVNDKSMTFQRVSDNRYNLLKNSTGEYFCYLDGDDFYRDDEFIERSVAILDSNPDYSGCASGYIRLFESSGEIMLTPIPETDVIVPEVYIKNRWYLHIGGILFNKKFVDSGAEYLAAKRIFDDAMITTYMLTRGNFIYTKIDTYVYSADAPDGWWSCMNQGTQHFINAHYFKFAKKAAPKHMKHLFHGLFMKDLQHIYNNKNTLDSLVPKEVIDKYSNFKRGNFNYWVRNMLNWNNLSQHKKDLCYRYYKLFRMPREADKL